MSSPAPIPPVPTHPNHTSSSFSSSSFFLSFLSRPSYSLLLLFLLVSYSLQLPSLSAAQQPIPPSSPSSSLSHLNATYAVATLVSTRAELLSARVLLHSVRRKAALPPDVALLLITTTSISPLLARSVAAADGLTHVALPPDDHLLSASASAAADLPTRAAAAATLGKGSDDNNISNNKRPHLFPHRHASQQPLDAEKQQFLKSPGLPALFALPFARVLFVAPHLLVTASLAPVLHCPALMCASFVSTPCSFSAALFVLAPDHATHDLLAAARRRAFAAATPPQQQLQSGASVTRFSRSLLSSGSGSTLSVSSNDSSSSIVSRSSSSSSSISSSDSVIEAIAKQCAVTARRPDWLSVDACILNAHFGKALLSAKLFKPESIPAAATLPPSPPTFRASSSSKTSNDDKYDEQQARHSMAAAKDPELMRRLPMGCLVAHHFYYPRFRVEVPEGTCGVVRLIDFSAPAFVRPARWTSYPLAQLSWRWHAARTALPPAPALDALYAAHIAACATGLALAIALALLIAARFVPPQPQTLLHHHHQREDQSLGTSTTGATTTTSQYHQQGQQEQFHVPSVAALSAMLPRKTAWLARTLANTPRDAARVAPLVALAAGLPAAAVAMCAAVAAVPADLAPPVALPLFLGWHAALLAAALHATGYALVHPVAEYAASGSAKLPGDMVKVVTSVGSHRKVVSSSDDDDVGYDGDFGEGDTDRTPNNMTTQQQQQQQLEQQQGQGSVLSGGARRRRGLAGIGLAAGLALLQGALVLAADVAHAESIYDRLFWLSLAAATYLLALVAALAVLSTVWMDAAIADANVAARLRG